MSGDFLSYFSAGARQAAKAKRKGKFWVIYNQFLHSGGARGLRFNIGTLKTVNHGSNWFWLMGHDRILLLSISSSDWNYVKGDEEFVCINIYLRHGNACLCFNVFIVSPSRPTPDCPPKRKKQQKMKNFCRPTSHQISSSHLFACFGRQRRRCQRNSFCVFRFMWVALPPRDDFVSGDLTKIGG